MTYQPFHVFGKDRKSQWLVTCDHATNAVPDFVAGGNLGLSHEDMNRHIAYDVGAKGVSQYLGEHLDAPVICSNFSRLVIDPNRGEDDPTLLMKLYDGTIIPANRNADETELQHRKETLYYPYHEALASLISTRSNPILLSIHSFTPQLRDKPARPWEIGVLYADDARLAKPLLDVLNTETDLTVGDNEPYAGHLPGDAIDKHALAHGRTNVLIEIRNDLITDDAGQRHWAKRLAPLLETALQKANL